VSSFDARSAAFDARAAAGAPKPDDDTEQNGAPHQNGTTFDIDLEIHRLAKLPPVEYAQARKDGAKRLGIRPSDLDDAVKVERRKIAASKARGSRGAQQPQSGTTEWPHGFDMRQDGLYKLDDSEVWICGPFEVLGQSRDVAGDEWGLWLRWQDADARAHSWVMPKAKLMFTNGELEAELVHRGLPISPTSLAKAALRQSRRGPNGRPSHDGKPPRMAYPPRWYVFVHSPRWRSNWPTRA
jgi:putative DNA primase/helicase